VRRFRWSKSSNKATGCIVYSNLNRLDVDRLDDADRERVETASKPYTESGILPLQGDGVTQRHRAYHAAYESDAFTVVFEADYATGYQTITVEDVSESERDDG